MGLIRVILGPNTSCYQYVVARIDFLYRARGGGGSSLQCNSIQRSDTHELNNLVAQGPRRFLGNVMATSFEHTAADVSGH